MKRIFIKDPSKSTSETASPSYEFVAAPGPKSDDEEGTKPETLTKDWNKNNAQIKIPLINRLFYIFIC